MDLSAVHHGVHKRKRKKRVGRGIGSGHGKTATRGSKGQWASAGACMIEQAMRTARTVSSASTGADRKLKLIAGCLRGSDDTMWMCPRLSGRIGWA